MFSVLTDLPRVLQPFRLDERLISVEFIRYAWLHIVDSGGGEEETFLKGKKNIKISWARIFPGREGPSEFRGWYIYFLKTSM